jgi:iron complex transport system ATP-binding protein
VSVPLLEAEGIAVDAGGTRILERAALRASAGELVAIVGPNGAGKSTLVRAVAGIQPMADGWVRWDGTDLHRLRGRRLAKLRAFVPQRPRVPEGMTVREAVLLGRAPHVGPLRRLGRHDHEAAERATVRAGVDTFVDRRLTTLSGGELQRVQVAVALAQDAPALLLDEPTSSLDLGATAATARLLRELADDGLAVVLVVHDLALAAALADRVVVVDHGRTIATGTPRAVLREELLADVWGVDARLDGDEDGRTGLRVDWLGALRTRTPSRSLLTKTQEVLT